MSFVVNKSDEEFYSDAAHYWAEVPATLDGMLGGFGFISQIDIRSSKIFLKQLFSSKNPPGRDYAADCGAGIGRITKFLLTDLFKKVDLIEQNPTFLEQAKQYLGPKLTNKIGEYYPVGLQKFNPEKEKYDVIWVQWVSGHLTDTDFVNFLKNCQHGLKENGIIVVKENIASTEEVELDEQDSSVTRPISVFHKLFEESNLDCYRKIKQTNFPKGIYSVYMFALRPKHVPKDDAECDNTKIVDINLLNVNNESEIGNNRQDEKSTAEIKHSLRDEILSLDTKIDSLKVN